MVTNHISAATGVVNAGRLNYQFPARTAAQLEETQALDATHVAPQRQTSRTEEAPIARPAPAPRKVVTPW